MTCCFPRVRGHMTGVSWAAGWAVALEIGGVGAVLVTGNLSRAHLWGTGRKTGGRGLSGWVGPVEGVLSGGRYGSFWNEKGLLGPSEPSRSRVGTGTAWRPEKGVWKLIFYPQGGGRRVPLERDPWVLQGCRGSGEVGRGHLAVLGPLGGGQASWSVGVLERLASHEPPRGADFLP